MKKITLLIAVLIAVAFVGQAEARGGRDVCEGPMSGIFNRCGPVAEHSHDVYDNTDHFKTGAYLQAILWESKAKNFEVGLLNTYLNETQEFTSMLGVKVYLNRLTYQK